MLKRHKGGGRTGGKTVPVHPMVLLARKQEEEAQAAAAVAAAEAAQAEANEAAGVISALSGKGASGVGTSLVSARGKKPARERRRRKLDKSFIVMSWHAHDATKPNLREASNDDDDGGGGDDDEDDEDEDGGGDEAMLNPEGEIGGPAEQLSCNDQASAVWNQRSTRDLAQGATQICNMAGPSCKLETDVYDMGAVRRRNAAAEAEAVAGTNFHTSRDVAPSMEGVADPNDPQGEYVRFSSAFDDDDGGDGGGGLPRVKGGGGVRFGAIEAFSRGNSRRNSAAGGGGISFGKVTRYDASGRARGPLPGGGGGARGLFRAAKQKLALLLPSVRKNGARGGAPWADDAEQEAAWNDEAALNARLAAAKQVSKGLSVGGAGEGVGPRKRGEATPGSAKAAKVARALLSGGAAGAKGGGSATVTASALADAANAAKNAPAVQTVFDPAAIKIAAMFGGGGSGANAADGKSAAAALWGNNRTKSSSKLLANAADMAHEVTDKINAPGLAAQKAGFRGAAASGKGAAAVRALRSPGGKGNEDPVVSAALAKKKKHDDLVRANVPQRPQPHKTVDGDGVLSGTVFGPTIEYSSEHTSEARARSRRKSSLLTLSGFVPDSTNMRARLDRADEAAIGVDRVNCLKWVTAQVRAEDAALYPQWYARWRKFSQDGTLTAEKYHYWLVRQYGHAFALRVVPEMVRLLSSEEMRRRLTFAMKNASERSAKKRWAGAVAKVKVIARFMVLGGADKGHRPEHVLKDGTREALTHRIPQEPHQLRGLLPNIPVVEGYNREKRKRGVLAMSKVYRARETFKLMHMQSVQFQTKSAVHAGSAQAIFDDAIRGLKSKSHLLTALNLSWEGLGMGQAMQLGKALHGNVHLVELDMTGNQLGNDGSVALGEHLPACRALKRVRLGFNLMGCSGACKIISGVHDGFKGIVTELRLDHNTINETDLSLTQAPWNKHDSNEDGIKHVAYFMASNSTLEHLSLSYNRIGDAGARELAKGLQQETTGCLRIMDLSNNDISDVGVAELVRALMPYEEEETPGQPLLNRKPSKLEALSLSGCNRVGDAGGEMLLELAHALETLVQVDLVKTAVSDRINRLLVQKTRFNRNKMRVRRVLGPTSGPIEIISNRDPFATAELQQRDVGVHAHNPFDDMLAEEEEAAGMQLLMNMRDGVPMNMVGEELEDAERGLGAAKEKKALEEKAEAEAEAEKRRDKRTHGGTVEQYVHPTVI